MSYKILCVLCKKKYALYRRGGRGDRIICDDCKKQGHHKASRNEYMRDCMRRIRA